MDLKSGKGVQVVSAGPSQSFTFNEALKNILQQYDVRDRSVVIVSKAGAFCKGNSYLLDYFLQYLDYKYNLNENGDGRLGGEEEPLSGFSWRGGSERDSTGLLFWSQPFKATLDNGEKECSSYKMMVVIYLMDTQGIFDNGSTVKDGARMFALSTMLSSVQIYNLSQNLAENDLQYLKLFTDYGRLEQQKMPGPSFQRLQILVRIWDFPYEHQYGAEGGRELLEKRLNLHGSQHSVHQLLREHIASCFHEFTCFLMPHPGLKVPTDPNFDGKLSEQATTEVYNLLAMAKAKEVFETLMEERTGGSQPYLELKELHKEYHRILDEALQVFRTKKMGGDHIAKTYSTKLVEEMEGQYEQCRQRNEDKRRPSRRYTAALLLVLVFVGYIVTVLAYQLGLVSLGTFGKLSTVTLVITLVVWIYARVAGKMRDLGMHLDYLAEYLCVNVLRRRN